MKKAKFVGNGFVYFGQNQIYIVSESNPRYEELLGELVNNTVSEEQFVKRITESVNPDLKELAGDSIEQHGSDFVYKDEDGGLLELPAPIYAKAQELIAKGASWEYLKKFWQRCLANPRPGSVHQLFEFVSKHLLTITDEGMFVAYKGVGDDYYDKHSHTYDNHPGNTVEMPREQVTYDPNTTCSCGLHVANYNYAQGWGDRVVVVLVDPADVVSVPVDSNSEKIRVCRYKVIEEYRDEHAFKEVPVVDKDLNILNHPETLDRERPWTATETKLLKSFMAENRDDIEVFAKTLKRAVNNVYAKLRELSEPDDNCDAVYPRYDDVKSLLTEDEYYKFYDLIQKYGRSWVRIADELADAGVTADYLRKLAKRLGWS